MAASASGIREAADALRDFADGHGLAKGSVWPFQVALDEVLSNVVRHGLQGDDDTREIFVELAYQDGVLGVTVVDDAPPFDPLAVAPPDLGLPAEKRPIGGLGIALVRELMDSVDYDRREGRNHLRFAKRVGA